MRDRLNLEGHQAWLFLAGILGGLTVGTQAPGVGTSFEFLLWPTLGALLYTTFVQVPLLHLRAAFRDARFLLALLLGNFTHRQAGHRIEHFLFGMMSLIHPG